MKKWFLHFVAWVWVLGGGVDAQEARVRLVDEVKLPGEIDGNSPAFWFGDRLRLFTSIGMPQYVHESENQFGPWASRLVNGATLSDRPIWIEAVSVDDEDVILGWYHHEPLGLFPDSLLTAPKIGALVSFDGGATIHDLGIVLESGDALDGAAKNGAFAGGHGDFSVILDRERAFFYFFFSNYGGPPESQGVAVARLAYDDRFEPTGKVTKYYQGKWEEPGCLGRVTPILPVRREWSLSDPDAFWGPSVHWNSHLQRYVLLLNRTKGTPGWSQEGIYVCFLDDLTRPESVTEPQKILAIEELLGAGQWYPQVIGLGPGETDRLAGKTARLYVAGGSTWEIDFFTDEEVQDRYSLPHLFPPKQGAEPEP